jgi:hypothetical protein
MGQATPKKYFKKVPHLNKKGVSDQRTHQLVQLNSFPIKYCIDIEQVFRTIVDISILYLL